jgi:hypothetical protein
MRPTPCVAGYSLRSAAWTGTLLCSPSPARLIERGAGAELEPAATVHLMVRCIIGGWDMRNLILLAAFVSGPVAVAQTNPTDAKVDCSLFTKKANGSWFLSRQTTIELSGSKINLPVGDVEARMLQYGMADLHSVLETACSDKKGEPSQGPKSETEAVK